MPRLIEILKKKAQDEAIGEGHNLGKFQRIQGIEGSWMSSCKDCGASVEIYESASKDQQIIGIGRSCGTDIEDAVPEETIIENAAATVTGRRAYADPNLQNIPVRTEECRAIRDAYLGDQGNTCPLKAEGLHEALEIIATKDGTQIGDDVIFPDGHEEKVVSVGHIGHVPQNNFMVQALAAEAMRPEGPDFCIVTPEDIAAHGGSLLAEDYLPLKRGDASHRRMKLRFHYVPGRAFPKLLVAYDAPKRAGSPVPKEKPRVGRMPDGTEYEMRHSGVIRVTSRRCENKEYDSHNHSVRRRLA